MRKCDKTLESMLNKNIKKCTKSWEIVRKCARSWESMRESIKSVPKVEKVAQT